MIAELGEVGDHRSVVVEQSRGLRAIGARGAPDAAREEASTGAASTSTATTTATTERRRRRRGGGLRGSRRDGTGDDDAGTDRSEGRKDAILGVGESLGDSDDAHHETYSCSKSEGGDERPAPAATELVPGVTEREHFKHSFERRLAKG